jgi:hypothetical protein
MKPRIKFTHFIAAKFLVRPDKDLEIDTTGEENRAKLQAALQILAHKVPKKIETKIDSIQEAEDAQCRK